MEVPRPLANAQRSFDRYSATVNRALFHGVLGFVTLTAPYGAVKGADAIQNVSQAGVEEALAVEAEKLGAAYRDVIIHRAGQLTYDQLAFVSGRLTEIQRKEVAHIDQARTHQESAGDSINDLLWYVGLAGLPAAVVAGAVGSVSRRHEEFYAH